MTALALRPCNGNDGVGCRIPHAKCICEVEDDHLFVYVELVNNEGDKVTTPASGYSLDDAIYRAKLRTGWS